VIYIQWHAYYCPELVFGMLWEESLYWEVLGSVANMGSGFGYIECEPDETCRYVDSEWSAAPEELQDNHSAFYRKVEPGESFGLFIRDVDDRDQKTLREAGEELSVLVGGLSDVDSEWDDCQAEEPDEEWRCKCVGDECARPEEYRNEYYYEDEVCSPFLGFGPMSIDWKADPIRMELSSSL
jgi:hypothetical protein